MSILPEARTPRGKVTLLRGDFLTTHLAPVVPDLVLTSPPYLTRIDYVKATLPELIVLSLIEEIDIPAPRTKMLGSPVVGAGPDSLPLMIGEYAKSILFRIAAHPSKASQTYYSAFYGSYISQMYSSLNKISLLTSPDARLILVVQGSYYKDIFVDLAKICIDLAASARFSLQGRADYAFNQSFAQLNPRANGYNLETGREFVLLFGKMPAQGPSKNAC